jgi:hypothetical protein
MIRDFVQKTQNGTVYQATLAVLALASTALLGYEFFGNPSLAEINIILALDDATAYLFLADFLIGVVFAQKKKLYLKQNWINLASSIPLNDATFRILRLLRIIRAVRVIRAANALVNMGQAAHFFAKSRTKNNSGVNSGVVDHAR